VWCRLISTLDHTNRARHLVLALYRNTIVHYHARFYRRDFCQVLKYTVKCYVPMSQSCACAPNPGRCSAAANPRAARCRCRKMKIYPLRKGQGYKHLLLFIAVDGVTVSDLPDSLTYIFRDLRGLISDCCDLFHFYSRSELEGRRRHKAD
jgi:hypothetical protein